jgi:NAD(P)-dependent dehydrogenase (short-subunit alcohol dehydrogenase family)
MSATRPADFRLDGKCAVVTGASSGIGAEIARAMSAAGADVALVGRDPDRLALACEQATAAGGKASVIAADLALADGPGAVVSEAVERFGRIDVLVHAAGLFKPTPLAETTDEELDAQWQVNVRAPYRLTREALPHLPRGGTVIFVSSIAGHVGFPNSSAYCATKGAVELMVKALSIELAPLGVRANAVAPGNIHTPMNAHLFAEEGYQSAMLAETPAGRVGEVTDIAPAVLFLASPAAEYVHGASLLVDGGWTAR